MVTGLSASLGTRTEVLGAGCFELATTGTLGLPSTVGFAFACSRELRGDVTLLLAAALLEAA